MMKTKKTDIRISLTDDQVQIIKNLSCGAGKATLAGKLKYVLKQHTDIVYNMKPQLVLDFIQNKRYSQHLAKKKDNDKVMTSVG